MSRSKSIFILSIVLLLFSVASFAYKLEVGIPGQAAPESDVNFVQYLEMIYQFAMWGVGLAAFVMLIWAGMQWIVSGLPDAKADAMEQIKAALMGLGLVLLSVLILQTINKDFTNSTLPDPNQIRQQQIDASTNPIDPGPQSASSVTGTTARCCYFRGNDPPRTEQYRWFTMGENMICEGVSQTLITGPDNACFEHGAGAKP